MLYYLILGSIEGKCPTSAALHKDISNWHFCVCISVRACLYFDSPPSVLVPSSARFDFISHWVFRSTEIGNLFVHFHGWPEWEYSMHPSHPIPAQGSIAQRWVTSASHSVHLFQSMRNNMANLLFDPGSAMLRHSPGYPPPTHGKFQFIPAQSCICITSMSKWVCVSTQWVCQVTDATTVGSLSLNNNSRGRH